MNRPYPATTPLKLEIHRLNRSRTRERSRGASRSSSRRLTASTDHAASAASPAGGGGRTSEIALDGVQALDVAEPVASPMSEETEDGHRVRRSWGKGVVSVVSVVDEHIDAATR